MIPKRIDPQKYGANCAECPFAKDKKPNLPVWGETPPSPIGIVVGEGPGRDESERGRPFVGATGQALDEELRLAGLDRAKLAILNATACIPKQPKDENEMREATVCCRPAFFSQLYALSPDLPVFAMGTWAYFALMMKEPAKGGMMKARGFIRPFNLPRKKK